MIRSETLDRMVEQYDELGYSIIEGIFSRAECERIRGLAEKLPSFTSGTLLPVMNPHRAEPAFLDVMGDERLVGAIRRLMDGEPVGLQTQYFFCRPGTRGFSFHQDNHYVQAPANKFVSAWLALDDVGPANGALIVLPGSHREPILEVRPIDQPSTFGQDPNHNRQECVVERDYKQIAAEVHEGGVVFLHSHLVHSSHHNSTDHRFRRALLMTYLAEGAPFRPGYIAQRKTFPLTIRP